MSDPYYGLEPQPPAARPAAALAAVVLLLLVFFVGLAVGQSGVLVPDATPRPSSVAVGPTPSPGASVAPSTGPLPSLPTGAPA
ncbi:MAG: hypothetical protein WD830_01680, partial [Chloroflexota bacterium]